MIGVFIGTYSSIFIASVFLIYWEVKFKSKKTA
jgi:preprotein translocase subunit SecF